MSFIFATGGMAFLLLTFCYLTIDVLGWWSGTPFRYPGKHYNISSFVRMQVPCTDCDIITVNGHRWLWHLTCGRPWLWIKSVLNGLIFITHSFICLFIYLFISVNYIVVHTSLKQTCHLIRLTTFGLIRFSTPDFSSEYLFTVGIHQVCLQ